MFLKLKRCVLTFGDIKDVCPKPVYFKREAVDRVETYKYLGMVFDSKLKWKENFNFVLKKVNLRMYCLRKLISFRVNFDMLITFHNAVMYSLNMFGAGCWGGNISKFDRGMLKKISNDEDAQYHQQTGKFVNWCDKNYLYLNVSKIKEMCIGFRKNQTCPKTVYIKGEAVERVETYKYLGVVFDRK